MKFNNPVTERQISVICSIIENPNCPEYILKSALDSPFSEVRELVGSKIVDFDGWTFDKSLLRGLCSNPNLSDENYNDLVLTAIKNRDYRMIINLSKNINIGRDIIDKLLFDLPLHDSYLNLAKWIKIDERRFGQLVSYYDDYDIKENLALNENLDNDFLSRLRGVNFTTDLNIIKNKNCGETLRKEIVSYYTFNCTSYEEISELVKVMNSTELEKINYQKFYHDDYKRFKM